MKIALISIIVLTVGLLPVSAETLHVPADYSSIQSAIDTAQNGDTVLIAPGTYTGDGNRDIDFLGKAITVRSENGPESTIIDCEGEHRGFYYHNLEGPDSVLEGFTITNGRGSAIHLRCSSPTITNCIFYNNLSNNGGALHCGYASSCGFASNPMVTDCVFFKNTSPSGAGGGAVYGSSSGVFTNCIFQDNSASSGGAVYGSSSTFINCIFIGNSASERGGAMKCWSSKPTLVNCTIVNNKAGDRGDGIYCGYKSNPEIINCIIWGNHDQQIDLSGSSVNVCYSDIEGGWPGTGNISADPAFVNSANGDYHLLSTSPCIDAGAPLAFLVGQYFADLDGNARLAGTAVDMGSYEYNSLPDSDGDLLADPEEIKFGTQSYIPDSDGDGLIDGLEVLRGTNPALPDTPPGISVPEQFETIQESLFFAFPLETITVSPGTYKETISFKGKNVILQSINPFDDGIVDNTVIYADGLRAVFTLDGSEDANCVIRGFTITNGGFSGIYGKGSKATIENNKIVDNHVPSLSGNSGGGGIRDCDGLIRNNSIISNHAGEAGGGIARCDGIIKNNIIANNTSGYRGGAISRCNGFVLNNVITDNSSIYGAGAIYCDRSWNYSPTIANCLIAGNITGRGNYGNGGAIYCRNPCDLKIFNCTIINNQAGGKYARGGGIYCKYGTPTLKNCIIRGNQGLKGSQIYITGRGAEVTISYSNIEDGNAGIYVDEGALNWGYGNTQFDSLFVDPNGDYHLLENSPCIDAGDPNYVAGPNETDLDGNPRIVNGIVDMGAFEYVPPIEAEIRITPRVLNLKSHGNWILCKITLPEDYNVTDIDRHSILLEGQIEPRRVFASEKPKAAIAMFSRGELLDILAPGRAEVLVTGQLTDGTAFESTDVIFVIDPPAHRRTYRKGK